MSVIRQMVKDAYRLSHEEMEQKLRALPYWPSEWGITRVLGIREAVRRLKNRALAELVYLGFVIIVDRSGTFYSVRTMDLMTGTDTRHMAEDARKDLEFEYAMKRNRSRLDVL